MHGEKPKAFVVEFSPEEHLPTAKKSGDESKRKKKRKGRVPIQISGAERADGGVLLSASSPMSTAEKVAFQNGAMIRLNPREIPLVGPLRITIKARAVEPTSGGTSQLSIALGKDAGSSAGPFKILGMQKVVSNELREYVFQGRLDQFPLQPHDAQKKQFIVIQNTFDPGTPKLMRRLSSSSTRCMLKRASTKFGRRNHGNKFW